MLFLYQIHILFRLMLIILEPFICCIKACSITYIQELCTFRFQTISWWYLFWITTLSITQNLNTSETSNARLKEKYQILRRRTMKSIRFSLQLHYVFSKKTGLVELITPAHHFPCQESLYFPIALSDTKFLIKIYMINIT